MLSSTADPLGVAHAEDGLGLADEIVGIGDTVGVAQLPPGGRVADGRRSHVVDPLALGDAVVAERREGLGAGDEAPSQVHDPATVGERSLHLLDGRVPARARQLAARAHRVTPAPRSVSEPNPSSAARLSRRRCWPIAIAASRPEVPSSLTPRVVKLNDTLARMGLRWMSNASSTIDSSVSRTGTTRWRLHTRTRLGVGVGMTSRNPSAAIRAFSRTWSSGGLSRPSRAAR